MIFNYEPKITEEEIKSVVECLRTGIANPKTNKTLKIALEDRFKTGCVLTSSGTSALHLALLSLGVSSGDEVICPDISFASSWNVIEYVGAKPVFVDCDPDTWCIDVAKIESLISKKTKAIMSVDLYGNSCNYVHLRQICDRYNIALIQDAAESLGTAYDGKSVLQQGDISCTSFNLNKVITSCGGGAAFSKFKNHVQFMHSASNQNKKLQGYDYHALGYNYRLGSINSALLLPQLRRLNKILEKKKQIHFWYDRSLSRLPNLKMQKIENLCSSNYWVNVIKFNNKKARDKVHFKLLASGVESKTTFTPASLVKWIKEKYSLQEMKNSIEIYETTLILPSSASLTAEDVDLVCNIIKNELLTKNNKT